AGARPPDRPQRLGIRRLARQLRADDHAGKAELDRAALELGLSLGSFERGYMGKPDEAPRIIGHRLAHAVVDEPTNGDIRLIKASAARKHAGVNSSAVHHAYVRGKIGEQRIEQIVRVAVLVEPRRNHVAIALE